LTHYRLTKRAEHELRLAEEGEGYGLSSMNEVGSGKARDPKKAPLADIIEKLNDLFGAEVSDNDQLHWVRGLADRMEREDDVMAQMQQYAPEQIMQGPFKQRLQDILLDTMQD